MSRSPVVPPLSTPHPTGGEGGITRWTITMGWGGGPLGARTYIYIYCRGREFHSTPAEKNIDLGVSRAPRKQILWASLCFEGAI